MRFPVTLDIQPSRRLRAAFVFVHLMAFFGLAGVLPVWSLGIVAPLLALSSWRACVAIRGVRLTLGSDGRVEWHPSAKASQAGEILADSMVFSWLTVLRVRLDGEQQVRSIVVLSDSVSPTDFRRLQIWMRWRLPFRQRVDAG